MQRNLSSSGSVQIDIAECRELLRIVDQWIDGCVASRDDLVVLRSFGTDRVFGSKFVGANKADDAFRNYCNRHADSLGAVAENLSELRREIVQLMDDAQKADRLRSARR